MTTYTYQSVILNGAKGWLATRRIDGVYAGKQVGRTQRAAREAFEHWADRAQLAKDLKTSREA